MQGIFEKARKFIYRNARPLDFARWRYFFEDGAAQDVVRALTAYQNPDGGFGHGLEADALNPNSAPIQTWNATVILREIGLFDPEHPVVEGINRYLTSGKHFDGHCWADSIITNNDYPHAHWWSFSESTDLSKRVYNPGASLAGWLLRTAQPGSVGYALGKRIAQEAREWYMKAMQENDMHLLGCLITLCNDVKITEPELFDADAMLDKLRGDVHARLLGDVGSWETSYCAMPSDLIGCQEDLFYKGIEALNEKECVFICTTQQEDGSWKVPWRWSDYPNEFAVSANYWKSYIIIKNILFLKKMEVH